MTLSENEILSIKTFNTPRTLKWLFLCLLFLTCDTANSFFQSCRNVQDSETGYAVSVPVTFSLRTVGVKEPSMVQDIDRF